VLSQQFQIDHGATALQADAPRPGDPVGLRDLAHDLRGRR
jgi:hypothetical protein